MIVLCWDQHGRRRAGGSYDRRETTKGVAGRSLSGLSGDSSSSRAARQALRDHVQKRRARMPLSSAGTPVCSIRVDKERRKLATSISTYDNKSPVLVQIQRKAKLLVTLENERISPQNPWQMSTLVAGLPCPRRSKKVKLCEHSTRIPR